MRTFEMLLLLALLMNLSILAVVRLRNAHRLRLSVVVALAFACAQVAIEGPRWQMVPAYGLALLLLVVAMASSFGKAGTPAGRRWRARIACPERFTATSLTSPAGRQWPRCLELPGQSIHGGPTTSSMPIRWLSSTGTCAALRPG